MLVRLLCEPQDLRIWWFKCHHNHKVFLWLFQCLTVVCGWLGGNFDRTFESDYHFVSTATATRYPGGRWCPQDEFECSNHLCVSQSWVCDGVDDCGDRSDEQLSLCCEILFIYCVWRSFLRVEKILRCFSCQWFVSLVDRFGLVLREDSQILNNVFSGVFLSLWSELTILSVWPVNITCEMPFKFRCANGYCIHAGLLCNQKDDCGDSSDEQEDLCMTHTYTPHSIHR